MDPVSQCFHAMQLANPPSCGAEGVLFWSYLGILLCISIVAIGGMEKCGREAGRKTASDSGISQSVIFGSVFRCEWLLANSGTVVFGERKGCSTVGHAGIVQSMAL